MRVLYDLAGAQDAHRFSPFCFRVKIAMRLKQLDYQPELVRFTEKDKLAFSEQALVPVLRDGDAVISDSWRILQYLDKTYPQAPSLFPDGINAALFWRYWSERTLTVAMFMLAAPHVYLKLAPQDQAYFRETREKRLGKTLEAVAAERELHLANLQRVLEPVRGVLSEQAWLASDAAPGMADLLVLSVFLWGNSVLPFELLSTNDPILPWLARLQTLWGTDSVSL
jgi:glutathione S-transferase